MSIETLEAAIQAGLQEVADAATPQPATAVRARGNRRRLRTALVATMTTAAVVAAGGVTGFSVLGGHHRHPAASPAASSGQDTSVSMQIKVPAVWAYDVPNKVAVTITNTGKARQVAVTVGLGDQFKPSQVALISTMLSVQTPGGSWQQVRVRHTASGWFGSYQLQLAAGSSAQQLQILPFWTGNVPPVRMQQTQPLSVSVSSGGKVLGSQQAPTEPVRYATATLTAALPGTQVRKLTLRADNATSTLIGFRWVVDAYVCNALGRACAFKRLPAADTLQWLDGSVWQTIKTSSGGAVPVTTGQLAAGSSTHVQLRLTSSAAAGKTGELLFIFETPNPLAFLEMPPVFFSRG